MMDMTPWTQDSGFQVMKPSMAETIPFSSKQVLLEKKARPQKEQALNCPRCNSTNTKFCYYNNYSQSQPRYFCKACRRYWTEGGSLRNVPVGGGSRKNKRSVSKRLADIGDTGSSRTHDGKDLNLTFPTPQDYKIGFSNSPEAAEYPNPSSSSLSAVDFMRNSINLSTASALSNFFPTNYNPYHAAASFPLGLNDFRQNTLSVDGFTGLENFQGVAERGKLGFTLEDLKQVSQTGSLPAGEASMYWNGAFGGAPAWTHVQNYGP